MIKVYASSDGKLNMVLKTSFTLEPPKKQCHAVQEKVQVHDAADLKLEQIAFVEMLKAGA